MYNIIAYNYNNSHAHRHKHIHVLDIINDMVGSYIYIYMNIVPGYVYSIHNGHIHIPYTYEMEMYTDEDIVPI